MFTGLVHERGRLAGPPILSGQGGQTLRLAHTADLARRLEVGASLAVSGVCLTVTRLEAGAADGPAVATVELSPETLARTTLGTLSEGDPVNLEPALRLGDPLGGHWVQGHVDTTVRVVERRDLTEHAEVTVSAPEGFEDHLVEKGSVTLDGVSLTVFDCREGSFRVALIPHTLEATTLGSLEPGTRLNLEIDVLAKYIHRALAARGVLGGDS